MGCGTITIYSKPEIGQKYRGIYRGVQYDIDLVQEAETHTDRIIPFCDIVPTMLPDSILLPINILQWWGERGVVTNTKKTN